MSTSSITLEPRKSNKLQAYNQRGRPRKTVVACPVRKENSLRGDKEHLNNVIASAATLSVQVRPFVFSLFKARHL